MGVFDIRQVFVNSDNGDQMRGTLDILLPFFQGEDDSQEFAIVNVIVSFSQDKSLREIGTGVGITIEVILEEDSTCCKERDVGHNGEGTSYIRDDKGRARGKGSAKHVKGFLLEGCPSPGLVLLGEEIKGGNNIGGVGYELVVEIGEAEERTNAFDRGGGVPVLNGSKFDWIIATFP